MNMAYFSDREFGPRPRVEEEISTAAWGGFVALIDARIDDGSFGCIYPLQCEEMRGIYGCDRQSFALASMAEIPDIQWPLHNRLLPPTLAILDLIEFCYRAIAKPIQSDFHRYYGHHHLQFDQEEGQTAFRDYVNRILARNGCAYELDGNGLVVRIAPEGLRQALSGAVFRTGDAELDSLLEAARTKYLDPDPDVRKEALEKLWDAWERLKTIEPGKDKKSSTTALLDKAASEPKFRAVLENEAQVLTNIGNDFRIRHSEVGKVPIEQSEQVDYLFHRLFTLIQLLLRKSGRCK